MSTTTWNNDTVRQLERASIRAFMERSRDYLKGRVLDFGAGKQPYRDIVQGEYLPIEQGDWIPLPPFNAIMCNQVFQYLVHPMATLIDFRGWLEPGGYLVMTYPTNWDEVETTDLWRFTRAGMEHLLNRSGFSILNHQRRAAIELGGFSFPLGYGVVAQ